MTLAREYHALVSVAELSFFIDCKLSEPKMALPAPPSFEFDEDGDAAILQADVNVPAAGEEADRDVNDSSLCACCERSPRVAKCKFGKECKKALNNVTSAQAKKFKADPKNPDVIKEHEHWEQVRKAGGAPLNAIIMSYRAQSEASRGSGNKRTSSFDLSQELEELRVSQSTTSGCQLLYMTQTRWMQVAAEKHGKSASEAKDDWDKALRTLPEYKQRGKGKSLKLPMPDEEYIRGEHTTSHSKAHIFSKKEKKLKEGGANLARVADGLQNGAFDLNDPLFKGTGNAIAEGAALAGMSVVSPSKTAGSSSDLQQALGAKGSGKGKDGGKTENPTKKKRYDLLAAKNKCRVKLAEDLKKARETLTKLVAEGETLAATHAASEHYECYVATLKQRLLLVTEAAIKRVVGPSVEPAPDFLLGYGECLGLLAAVRQHDFNVTGDEATSQLGVLRSKLSQVAKTFPARDADGMATTATGQLVPLSQELLNEANAEGDCSVSQPDIHKLKVAIPEFLQQHLAEHVLQIAVQKLETLPLDDISKVRPLMAVEDFLLYMLESATDED